MNVQLGLCNYRLYTWALYNVSSAGIHQLVGPFSGVLIIHLVHLCVLWLRSITRLLIQLFGWTLISNELHF